MAMAVVALVISGLSYYRSYIYTKQDLEITVTEVSYVTNQGELYISVAFSNGGNRDAAVLRIEPALGERGQRRVAALALVERPRAPQHPGDLAEDAAHGESRAASKWWRCRRCSIRTTRNKARSPRRAARSSASASRR